MFRRPAADDLDLAADLGEIELEKRADVPSAAG